MVEEAGGGGGWRVGVEEGEGGESQGRVEIAPGRGFVSGGHMD